MDEVTLEVSLHDSSVFPPLILTPLSLQTYLSPSPGIGSFVGYLTTFSVARIIHMASNGLIRDE
jgi:hypothetical protein